MGVRIEGAYSLHPCSVGGIEIVRSGPRTRTRRSVSRTLIDMTAYEPGVSQMLSPQFGVAVLLWIALGVYGFSALWWLFETVVLSHNWAPDSAET